VKSRNSSQCNETL